MNMKMPLSASVEQSALSLSNTTGTPTAGASDVSCATAVADASASEEPASAPASVPDSSLATDTLKATRPEVRGKFLFVNNEKFYVRGVTYGPFRPEEDGCEYHTPEQVTRDFALMAANGINSVRIYTVPPRWLLDIAAEHGLKVMVGLPWEQHLSFLDGQTPDEIINRLCTNIRPCVGHPALLCYAIGNEIPANMVRWYGSKDVQAFLYELYQAIKEEDPGCLVTYVNFPTTEYLELPFLDLVAFNVYLEHPSKLEPYLAKLQNLAGERPMLMGEVGLDSLRNGDQKQCDQLTWQLRSVFASGSCGVFAFAWTDEWFRGGMEIEDWLFGLTTRDRKPKPALAAVAKVYAEVPFPADTAWPRVTVVCCTYNGKRTIRDTCEGLKNVVYPNFEVIFINDGSTDGVEKIPAEYGFRVISTPNRGLSAARNLGYQSASGSIVAYIDDDAFPDPHWLQYLAHTFMTTKFVAVGGPNLLPLNSNPIADCVYNSPGGPVHVLLTDTVAEHIPGCNMAFLKSGLEAINGFDTQFRIAGDDVDLCWRLQENVGQLGFSPAAMVWHHRRPSIKAYWRQQKNYGRAEAMLERKWPQKYNAVGHVSWGGRLYGKGGLQMLTPFKGRIYQGMWGSAPFQSLYKPGCEMPWALPMMPEWYVLIAALTGLSLMGPFWQPMYLAAPLLVLAVIASLVQAALGGVNASFQTRVSSGKDLIKLQAIVAFLHLAQPLSRLVGRISFGLTPLRWRNVQSWVLPWPSVFRLWSEKWEANETRLEQLKHAVEDGDAVVLCGGDYDRWDLQVRGGLLGSVRLRMAIEEHGYGKQMILVKAWPVFSIGGLLSKLFFSLLTIGALASGAYPAAVMLATIVLLFALRSLQETGAAFASLCRVLDPSRLTETQWQLLPKTQTAVSTVEFGSK